MAQTSWQISGDYFENCNCSVVCPCLVSPLPPLTATPTEGDCHVALAFHINKGRYGDTVLDGLNIALVLASQGPMGNGNMTAGAYIDERADAKQTEALGAIFSGGAGGPMAAFAPLITKHLAVKKTPIAFKVEGRSRAAEIPGIMNASVQGLPSIAGPDAIIWAETGHPFNPTKLALAVGGAKSSFADHGMRWDNSGKNGHFASINWSN